MVLQKQRVEKTKGTCTLCGNTYGRIAIKRHLESCVQKHENNMLEDRHPENKKIYRILAEGSFKHEYWLYFDIPANARLKRIDDFLREMWVECCGHLSRFAINETEYMSDPEKDYNELSMSYVLDRVLSAGMKFGYEYDFGSPTRLTLKVVSEREAEVMDNSIVLLAQNQPTSFTCGSCRETATRICGECSFMEKGLLCDKCAPSHECGELMLLPVVNSPRVGVCGYTGKRS